MNRRRRRKKTTQQRRETIIYMNNLACVGSLLVHWLICISIEIIMPSLNTHTSILDLVCCRRLLVFFLPFIFGRCVCVFVMKKGEFITALNLRLIICFIVAASCMWITIKIKLLSKRTLRHRPDRCIQKNWKEERRDERNWIEDGKARSNVLVCVCARVDLNMRREVKPTIKGNKIHVSYEIRRKHNTQRVKDQ